MRITPLITLCAATLGLPACTHDAGQVTVDLNRITAQGTGPGVGQVRFSDGPQGLVIEPDLNGLPPGEHGFHVHQKPDCGPGEKDGQVQAGIAAGGHLDPAGDGRHAGPEGQGHLGDLPRLTVGADGHASGRMVAPRLKLADLRGHSIMVHEGGDNYADQPKPLGGGGGRIACGVVK